MTVRELILVRHGQSVGNVAAEAADRDELHEIDVPARDPDVELSETGREQAEALGRWLAEQPEDERPEVVWTSPYRRARETAEIALGVCDAQLDFRVDERLRDRDMGVTDMLTAYGIREKYPEEAERREWIGKFYYRPSGGESWADVAFRVRSVLTDLANTEKSSRVLVSAHDVVILLFCYVAEGLDEEAVLERSKTNGVRNAAICRLVRDEESPSGWTVTAYNEDEHLREKGAEVTDEPEVGDEVAGERVEDDADGDDAGER
ncbi:MAG: histidine phosphatase family protein [Actinomycetia bacterium]|nr:histidine phosphatase family protein [Actinomycetes bacterium]